MESLFFQSINCEGEEIPLALMLSGTYIETVYLDSPKLILDLVDTDGGIRDSLGVAEGKIITASMSDVAMPEADSFVERFVIVGVKPVGDKLLIEGLQKDVYQIKQHLNSPRFFVDKSPGQILKALLPSLRQNLVGINGRGTYHVHNGVTPSHMLRYLMARDFGALLFVSRGIVNMISLDEIARQSEELELEYQNPQAERGIWSLSLPFAEDAIKRKQQRHYVRWHENDGMVSSNDHNAAAKKIIIGATQGQLENASKHMVPILTGETRGTTQLPPAKRVKLILNRFHESRPIDESIPNIQTVVRSVCHQSGYTFICSITTGITNAE